MIPTNKTVLLFLLYMIPTLFYAQEILIQEPFYRSFFDNQFKTPTNLVFNEIEKTWRKTENEFVIPLPDGLMITWNNDLLELEKLAEKNKSIPSTIIKFIQEKKKQLTIETDKFIEKINTISTLKYKDTKQLAALKKEYSELDDMQNKIEKIRNETIQMRGTAGLSKSSLDILLIFEYHLARIIVTISTLKIFMNRPW